VPYRGECDKGFLELAIKIGMGKRKSKEEVGEKDGMRWDGIR
jgi:hypothetical protein